MVQLMKKLSDKRRVKSISPIAGVGEMPDPDILVVTSGGVHIPAHSKILASASPVLETIIERPQINRATVRKIPIQGVPNDAVSVFLQFLYYCRCSDDQMEKYGVHLLALSHVYSVQPLKRRCTSGLGKTLTVENVVDMLQLARLCDAPDLYLRCMKLLSDHFEDVEETEGWRFLQTNDPYLELEILQFIDESELMKKRTKRHRKEQNLYTQLSEAMDCLEHICSEGCTDVGPYNVDPNNRKGPCDKFSTCQGIQLLIKHFGTCKRRVNGGCLRCKRMWQLFRLHSSVCDRTDECRVPLCRRFKLKVEQDEREDDARWRLLVRKVVLAKAVSVLSRSEGIRLEGMRRFGLIEN